MMASRIMATKECWVHENIKQELVKRQEHHTTLICKSINLQGRALLNTCAKDVLKVEKEGGGLKGIIPLISGKRTALAWQTGEVEVAPIMVGQSIGLIDDIPTMAELFSRMVSEAEASLGNALAKF